MAAARNLAAVLAKEDRFAYRSLRKLANLEHQAGDEGDADHDSRRGEAQGARARLLEQAQRKHEAEGRVA